MQRTGFQTATYLEWYRDEPLVAENLFLTDEPEDLAPPRLDEVRHLLPLPSWPENSVAIQAYWKAWELAFSNLRQPVAGSGFVSNFIDTAFNDCLFMWDSAFIVQFGKYGDRGFRFQKTLDNLYARQHPDGFICREIREKDGSDQWHRHVPYATGPNILAWAEFEYFKSLQDVERVRKVYAPLLAFHRWMKRNQTWQNGSYWTTGLGCGMDNMPRTPSDFDAEKDHASMTWIDATCQAILSAKCLETLGWFAGRPEAELRSLRVEAEALTIWVNAHLWDQRKGFYFDGFSNGQLSGVKQVGAYWALLAGIVPPDRQESFVDHLNDPKSFKRPHRVPSLAADQMGYEGETGGYWQGGVWAPTNYMILRGLSGAGEHDLAYSVGRNHLDNVLKIFKETGTLWENYSPEMERPGSPAKRDFVGWTGLSAISILFEYVFGLRPLEGDGNILLWDIRLIDGFGVDRYPLGPSNELSLHCKPRATVTEEPQVDILANETVSVEVRWSEGRKVVSCDCALGFCSNPSEWYADTPTATPRLSDVANYFQVVENPSARAN